VAIMLSLKKKKKRHFDLCFIWKAVKLNRKKKLWRVFIFVAKLCKLRVNVQAIKPDCMT
jgi:hypothetical protein